LQFGRVAFAERGVYGFDLRRVARFERDREHEAFGQAERAVAHPFEVVAVQLA
jgi:hypothetical protein